MARRRTHPGSIEKRGNGFRVRLCVSGRRHYFTLPSVTHAEAVQFSRDKQQQLEQEAGRRAAGLPGGLRMSELFDRIEREHLPDKAPRTRMSYGDALKPLRTYFVEELGDPPVGEIKSGHVRNYLAWRRMRGPRGSLRNQPVSKRTRQLDRAVLHVAFELALTDRYVDFNPVASVPAPKADKRDPVLLSDAELERLLATCSDDDVLRLYVLTLAETGVRCESEALWLRWEDVRLDDGFLWIASGRDGHRTKSGEGRWVPMPRQLREAFRAHFARCRFATYGGRPSHWVFHHPRTRGRCTAGERIASLRHGFEAACRRARMPEGFRQHDLRHRRVTTWLAEEKNPVHVKEALGHAHLSTTMQYTHLAREHLRSLIDDDAPKAEQHKGRVAEG